MKAQAAFLFAVLILADVRASSFTTSARRDDDAWLFFNDPPVAQRYDLKQRKWLTPVSFAEGEVILAVAASADTVYVAMESGDGAASWIERFDSEGKRLKPLAPTRWKPAKLFVDGNLLIAVASRDYDQKFRQIQIFDRIGSGLLGEFSSYAPIVAPTLIPGLNRLVGYTPSIQRLSYRDYDENGKSTDLSKSPWSSASEPGEMWTLSDGDDAKIIDSQGRMVSAQTLDFLGTIGKEISDVADIGDGTFVVGSKENGGYKLTRFTHEQKFLGVVVIPIYPTRIWVCGDAVVAFLPSAPSLIEVSVTPLEKLGGPYRQPARPVLMDAAVSEQGVVMLQWKSSGDATAGYYAQRKDISDPAGDWVYAASAGPFETSLMDSRVTRDKRYAYRLIAVNTLKMESEPSNELEIGIPTAPVAPKPDVKRPTVDILEGNLIVTPHRRLVLHADASDNRAVEGVEFSVQGERWRPAMKSGEQWGIRVALKERRTSVRVRARDTSGNYSEPFRTRIVRTVR